MFEEDKVVIKESVLNNLIAKALPEEYELLLGDEPLSDDEEDYFNLILYLLNSNISVVINWLNSDDAQKVLNGVEELGLDFWDKIEDELRINFNNKFEEIIVLLLGFYSVANGVSYSLLNLSPVFTQQDWSALGIIKQQNYNVVNDLLKDLNKNLRDTLWKGIKEGLDVQEIAQNLVKAGLEPVGKFTPQARAKAIAVTEKSRIINTARLQCFVDNGIREFNIVTAHDSKVCSICLINEQNNPYTLEQIQGMIPVHPHCRCLIYPVINNGQVFTEDDFTPYIVDLTEYFMGEL